MKLFCLLIVAVAFAGCGSAESEPPAYNAALAEREYNATYTTAMLYSLCRDADLGKSRPITTGIREMTDKVMRAGRLHPNDKFDSDNYSTPAEALHLMADTAKCKPALAMRLEVAARDSEDRQAY